MFHSNILVYDRVKKIYYQKIILFLFYLLPVVDSYNGYIENVNISSSFKIGQIWRIMILFFALFSIIKLGKISKSCIKRTLIFSGFLLISIYLNIMFTKDVFQYVFAIKLINNFLLLELLNEMFRKRIIAEEDLIKILNTLSFLLPITIIIPKFFELGFHVYSSDLGYKGFYYSQNELSGVLFILVLYSIGKLYYNFSIFNILRCLPLILCLLWLSSKTSYIMLSVVLCVFIIRYLISNNKKKLLLVSSLIISIPLSVKFVSEIIIDYTRRQRYLRSIFDNNFLNYITSGRYGFLKDAYEKLINSNDTWLKVIIGNGFQGTILIEMDFFDIFFYVGLIGLLFIVYYIINIFIKSLRKQTKFLDSFVLYVIFLISFFSGHIIFMGMTGSYLALIICYQINCNIQEFEENISNKYT